MRNQGKGRRPESRVKQNQERNGRKSTDYNIPKEEYI